MAPTDAVLQIMQQIQETLAEHPRRFDRIDRRFNKVDHRLDELQDSMITALGLAGRANVRHDSVNGRLDELTRRVEDLERAK